MTDSRLEKIRPDINIQLTKTNNDTENEREKPSSENVNSDMEIRIIDPYSSFPEGPQETDIQNNSDSESEDESISKEASLDKTEQAYDSNANSIVEIRDNFLHEKITL